MNSFSLFSHIYKFFNEVGSFLQRKRGEKKVVKNKDEERERGGFILKRVNNAFQMERVRSLPVGSRSILPWCIGPPKVHSIYSLEERGHLYSRA